MESPGATVRRKANMTPLRVLIMRQDQVVDVHAFDDPRKDFVEEFNRINGNSTFWAVCEEEASPPWMNRLRPTCNPRRSCEEA